MDECLNFKQNKNKKTYSFTTPTLCKKKEVLHENTMVNIYHSKAKELNL